MKLTAGSFAFALCILLSFGSVAQQQPAGINSLRISKEYLETVLSRAAAVEQKVNLYSTKSLRRLQKLEQRIFRKLTRIDSMKGMQLIRGANEKYKNLDKHFPHQTSSFQQYIPSLDTLNTSLEFLEQNPQFLSPTENTREKLDAALDKMRTLQGSLGKAENIQKFLKERKEYLRQQLQQLGFARQLKKLNKQAYYYSEQLNEYKALLKDKKKAERKAVELLSKTKLFKDFMRRNSQLASLFRLPGDPSDPGSQASLAGLQTRAQVNNLIQQQIASGGTNAQQQFQQNMQEAQSQLKQLKDKLFKSISSSGNSGEMPEGFKPNNQKTKSFWNRLEYGTNIQSQKPNGYFPVTSDIGLSLGYKLNDKSVIGIGASYKIGWGQNIRDIKVTNQGAGLRSFVDWKVKGSFWLSGGYEMNYRSEFNRMDVLKELNAWQQSGLLGLSKTVSLRSKFFKKTKLQLLWDFLSYEQVPRTQPIVFRIGYNLK